MLLSEVKPQEVVIVVDTGEHIRFTRMTYTTAMCEDEDGKVVYLPGSTPVQPE